MGMARWIVLK
jgi:hypothetical protein